MDTESGFVVCVCKFASVCLFCCRRFCLVLFASVYCVCLFCLFVVVSPFFAERNPAGKDTPIEKGVAEKRQIPKCPACQGGEEGSLKEWVCLWMRRLVCWC